MMEMTRTALSLNENNRLAGLLWHQGETDATLNASFDVHYAHLMALVQSVRNEFGVPELPFIAGDFVQHWKMDNIAVCTPVVAAIRAVCADCGHGGFVETDGLASNLTYANIGGDVIHFCRPAQYELGHRYYDAFIKAEQK